VTHNSFFKNLTIVIFLAVLCINFILFFTVKKYEIDTIANKEKLSFPVYDTSGISGFMRHYEAYFIDHFPYKYAYIKTLNYIKNDALKSYTASDKVIIGKNNWLFYNASIFDSLGLNEHCGYYQWNASQLHKVVSNLKAIQSFCQKNNIQFQLLICPSKQSIYPEYLPANYAQKQDNRYDQLYQAFPEAINLKNILLTYKQTSRNLLYYKTDTHWNLLAGAIACKTLAQRLTPNFSNIITFNDISIKDFSITSGKDLANMLALKNCYADTTYQIQFNEKNTAKIPHVLIVHDSFLESLDPGFSYLFSKITKRQLFVDGIPSPETLLKERPDVFIIELTERYKELLTWNIHPDYFK
jgi:alginate O-acetyltransferase complex protein AlgJ